MAKKIPSFTYSGSYSTASDDTYWYIYCKSNGSLVMKCPKVVDVFAVGGGGGSYEQGGGGGGYTTTARGLNINAGVPYEMSIGDGGGVGARGGTTYALNSVVTAEGGYASTDNNGAQGGSGGGAGSVDWSVYVNGGSDGGDGANSQDHTGGKGQGTTTRAFGESTGALYAGGGSGAGHGGSGGSATDGGGAAAFNSASANTGGGAGGGGNSGGSGIVIIRGMKEDTVPVIVNGTELEKIIFNGVEVTSLIYNGAKLY